MTFNISKFQFACEVFGYDIAKSINEGVLQNYYSDWKTTGLNLNTYKSLLKSRG